MRLCVGTKRWWTLVRFPRIIIIAVQWPESLQIYELIYNNIMIIHWRTVERIKPRWEPEPPGLNTTNQIAVLWPIKRNQDRGPLFATIIDCMRARTFISRLALLYRCYLLYLYPRPFLFIYFFARSMASACAY